MLTIALFWADPGPAIEILMGNHRRVDLEFCYCSIYTECWISHSGTTQAVSGLLLKAFRKSACEVFGETASPANPCSLPAVLLPPTDPILNQMKVNGIIRCAQNDLDDDETPRRMGMGSFKWEV